MKKIGENYKRQEKQTARESDIKYQLKNKQLYGAYYQQENQKYVKDDKF